MIVHYRLEDLVRIRRMRSERFKESLHWANHGVFATLAVLAAACALIPAAIALLAVIAHDSVWHRIHDL